MFDELLRLHQYPSVYTPREEDHLQTNNFFPKERLDKKFYYQIIAKYDLPNFEHCFPLQNTEFLTFLYRITTQYGWVKQFLRDGEYEPIRDLLVKNLMYLAPDPAKKDAKRFLIDQVYGDNPPPPQTRDEAVAARVRAVAPKPDESLSKEFEQAYISSLKKERAKKK
uniref:Prophage protein n=2 Tax=Caenorhabditis tropicalis TaxID=1561998 RepID=A0A1I7UP62_9PELO